MRLFVVAVPFPSDSCLFPSGPRWFPSWCVCLGPRLAHTSDYATALTRVSYDFVSHVIRAIRTDRRLGGQASYHAGLSWSKAFVLIEVRPLCVSRKRPENSAYRPVPAGSGRHTAFLRLSEKQEVSVEKTSYALTRASPALASSWLRACRALRLSLRARARCLLARVRAIMNKDFSPRM